MEGEQIIKLWEDAIRKQLGERTIEEMDVMVYPGIRGKAFAHTGNAPEVAGRIEAKIKGKIGVRFGSEAGNEDLLSVLNLGAESIDVVLQEETDIPALLHEVRLDLIWPVFRCSDTATAGRLNSYLKEEYPGQKIPFATNESIAGDFPDAHYLIDRYEGEDKIEELVHICQKAKDFDGSAVAAELVVGDNFFFEIARIRALRILLANLKNDASFGQGAQLIAFVQTAEKSKDALIAQTSAALSAFLGGASIVQINTWDNKHFNDDRLSLHIQNILINESWIRSEQDAAAGSYYVEDLTEKIARKVWEKL